MREALHQAGLSGREVSRLAGWDPSKLSDLFNGKDGVTESDVNRLVGVCRFPPEQADDLVTVFRLTQERGLLQLRSRELPTGCGR